MVNAWEVWYNDWNGQSNDQHSREWTDTPNQLSEHRVGNHIAVPEKETLYYLALYIFLSNNDLIRLYMPILINATCIVIKIDRISQYRGIFAERLSFYNGNQDKVELSNQWKQKEVHVWTKKRDLDFLFILLIIHRQIFEIKDWFCSPQAIGAQKSYSGILNSLKAKT